MDYFRKPFRYNITVQYSPTHGGYICFVGALLKSANMFAPSMDIIGQGDSPDAAITNGLNKAYEFLSFLDGLAILPPREEILDSIEFETTVNIKENYGNRRLQ